MELWRFKKEAFSEVIKGWHMPHPIDGSRTLCGLAEEGMGYWVVFPDKKEGGKPTCESCLKIIRECKKVKS